MLISKSVTRYGCVLCFAVLLIKCHATEQALPLPVEDSDHTLRSAAEQFCKQFFAALISRAMEISVAMLCIYYTDKCTLRQTVFNKIFWQNLHSAGAGI